MAAGTNIKWALSLHPVLRKDMPKQIGKYRDAESCSIKIIYRNTMIQHLIVCVNLEIAIYNIYIYIYNILTTVQVYIYVINVLTYMHLYHITTKFSLRLRTDSHLGGSCHPFKISELGGGPQVCRPIACVRINRF